MSSRIAIDRFRERFGREPEIVVRAPGRVNLIGEHTDYNGGFVFPCAVDREITLVAATSEGGSVFTSRELGDARFSISEAGEASPQGWARYGAGMAVVLKDRGLAPRDLLVYVESDIPMGSGVSSSAALELAFGIAYAELGGVRIPSEEMALLAQKCENAFVGVNCGIMDQMASACGRENRAMFLDTRDLSIVYAPLPDGVDVVLLDTKKPRALTDSAYNERRAQCEEACRELGVAQLRDADIEMLRAKAPQMDGTVFRRARHVVTENARATEFYSALTRGDLGAAGRLMREIHASLRDDYEVSCRELDAMADAANASGAIGARMTGAGFGGCCVALVPSGDYDRFARETLESYARSAGRAGTSLRLRAVDGANAIDPT